MHNFMLMMRFGKGQKTLHILKVKPHLEKDISFKTELFCQIQSYLVYLVESDSTLIA